MMVKHRFGGEWTERKLGALGYYLVEYQKIFTRNPAAKKLKTIYVDAFAGTGERDLRDDSGQELLFGYQDDIREYQKGSVSVALSLENKFHQYVFLDSKASHAKALELLVSKNFPELKDRCEIRRAEANEWLQKWCQDEDWRGQRAVVFLDPYGMGVEWATVEAIARTKAIDLWVLFPLGIGPNRVLPNDMPPEGAWAERLTKLFGTDEWKTRFYRKNPEVDLLGDARDSYTKIAGVDEILRFFIERLNSVFAGVVANPLVLENSKNSPMYALCFAAGNPKGAPIAVKIASYLTRK
jgi:three-Cys-motif partner protein